MNIAFRDATPADAQAVVDIFNHYIEHSYSAYQEAPVDITFFDKFFQPAKELAFYVAEDNHKVIGFGFLRPFRDGSAFKHCATITYFILPGYTGLGLGKQFLQRLENTAREKGISNILAHISSKNLPSLNFHKKFSFAECGRFQKVGRKHGDYFDMVWMQKFI